MSITKSLTQVHYHTFLNVHTTNSPFSYSILGGYPTLSYENQIYQDSVSRVPYQILIPIDSEWVNYIICARGIVIAIGSESIDA